MNTYENALKQLDEIINHLRNNQSADCSKAEEQDLQTLRFKTLKRVLSPNDQASIDKIAAYYAKNVTKQA
ncbi:hypothetical protein [Neisseria wadsworthii]|uniref:Gas vesicle structural protein GvpC n=1 Tax=Neisseria wadsworthii 9715 TaxID=1030841 RepID=G4CQZ3_9NEIS|nr:hypothetical protein [Neisseria wadsworthii]EGZ45778.1 gas vesicle structural protein GvpC [Neisseria wadsworthii 9715]QMT35222.1 hypothetical protein H3L96_09195 [Neisseria wadsworthii]